jgi:hypothetical protein
MRKVMMVVAVLMTSCQVSLKPKSGPVSPQMAMAATAETEGERAAGDDSHPMREAREPACFRLHGHPLVSQIC